MILNNIEYIDNKVKLIDQTKLPHKIEFFYCDNVRDVSNAIKNMKVRGAPAIGIIAAFGVYLAAKNSKTNSYNCFKKEISQAIKYIKSSRPTAVNLFYALDRMWNKFVKSKSKNINIIKDLLLEEASLILEQDKENCKNLSVNGSKIIKQGDCILTHCNAGALATAGYGTVLGVFFYAKRKGKKIHIYVDETRPCLQGAKLTAWELKQKSIPFTLICDSMAGMLMRQNKIDKIIVGADRIALNGDTANKIGTYSLAVLAKFHNIPFYVAAPLSSFDLKIKKGNCIPIEERNIEEITFIENRRIAPEGIDVFNPAFDITPSEFITSIITEKGIIKPPYIKNIGRFVKK